MKPIKKNRLLLCVMALVMLMSVVSMPAAAAAETAYANTVYLQDGGEGDGLSSAAPAGSLKTLLSGLTGSTHVILTGDYTTVADEGSNTRLDNATYGIKFTSALKITAINNAKLILASHIVQGGDLEIDDITIQSEGDYWFKCQLKSFTVGENVTCVLGENSTTYPTIVGTTTLLLTNKTVNITIKSGKWNKLRAGSAANPNSYNITSNGGAVFNTDISGGTFYGYVALGSRGNMTGACVRAGISGGTFLKGIYVIYGEDESITNGYRADYDADIVITGGEFHGVIAPTNNNTNTLYGTYNLTLQGGDFSYLSDLLGPGLCKGTMTSTLCASSSLLSTIPAARTQTFTNPIFSGADPFLFMKDGMYYMVKTASKNLVLYKGTSLAELKNSSGQYVFTLTDGNNLWSPEIHYFSASEVGAANAGWYCFISYTPDSEGGDTMAERQRQYVLKCLDPDDNLFGTWGDPVTGEASPRKVTNPDYPEFNNGIFVSGSSKMVVDGVPYMTYVTEIGRETEEFHQEIMITAMDNPWTYRGTPVSICKSDYHWEEMGYGYSEYLDGTMMWFPKVVEGASPVYYTDSSGQQQVYLMYTGSGYWTQWYALGYLKLTNKSDPLNAASWQKMTERPILQRDTGYAKNDINGCGHGSYLKVGDNYWVAYHAYLEKYAQGGRYAMIEPIYVDETGVAIGDRDGHPANLSKTYTVYTAQVALYSKANGFDSIESPETVIFVDAAGGSDAGDGLTANTAVSTVGKALEILAQYRDGGTLVICAPSVLTGDAGMLASTYGEVTFTSVYHGSDYRQSAGACLYITDGIMLGDDTAFADVDFVTDGAASICACYHDVTVTGCRLYANAGTAQAPSKGAAVSESLLTLISGARSTAVRNYGNGLDFDEDDFFGGPTDPGKWFGGTDVNQTVTLNCLSWARVAAGSKAVGTGIYTSSDASKTDIGNLAIIIGDNAGAIAVDTVSDSLNVTVELPTYMQSSTAYTSDNALSSGAETTVFIAAEKMADKHEIVSFRNGLSITSASVQISDSLSMNYYVDKTLFTEKGYSSPSMAFTFNGETETVTSYTDTGSAYVFEFAGVCPQEMGDEIAAVLNAVHSGRTISYELSYSVEEYLYDLLDEFAPERDDSAAAGLVRTLAADLLNYGAAVQTFSDYKTGSLVNAEMTARQQSWATSDTPVYNTVKNAAYTMVAGPAVVWRSASLTLKNKVDFVLKFSTDENISGLKLRIIKENGAMTEIPGSSFVKNGYYYTVSVPGVMLHEFKDRFLFVIYKSGAPVSDMVSYSVESYAYSMSESTVDGLTGLLSAMIKCCDSALAYSAAPQ